MFGLDVSTPHQRPPALNAPPPLLPPDTDAPPTDEGPLGTRRVPAPSPGRPHLARQNSMDFLNEAGPDLSTGRRKVLNLSARLQQTARAPSIQMTSQGRAMSYTPAHSSSFDSFQGNPTASSTLVPVAASGVEIKVSPASPSKEQLAHRAEEKGSKAQVPALEAGVELSALVKPRKGKSRSRVPLAAAPSLPPSALRESSTPGSPVSGAAPMSAPAFPPPPSSSSTRPLRPSTMMRRSSSARDVNPLVRAAAEKAVAASVLDRKSISSSTGLNEEAMGLPPTPPPGQTDERMVTRVIKSKPRLTRSASMAGGLSDPHHSYSAPVSPRSRTIDLDFGPPHPSSTVTAGMGDGPEVFVPRSKRAKRSPSPPSSSNAFQHPSTSSSSATHLLSPPHSSAPLSKQPVVKPRPAQLDFGGMLGPVGAGLAAAGGDDSLASPFMMDSSTPSPAFDSQGGEGGSGKGFFERRRSSDAEMKDVGGSEGGFGNWT